MINFEIAMINLFDKFINHFDLYRTSFLLGTLTTSIYTIFNDFTTRQFFGTSLILWSLLLLINVIDIYTGIKADTKRKKDLNVNFKFESGKGWRAIEKIFIFTVAIGFLFIFEKEAVSLDLPKFTTIGFTYTKLTIFFYAFLIELQSIGENEETRFGKKGKMFTMLDNIIEIVNEGLLNKIKNFFKSSDNTNSSVDNNDNEIPDER